MSYDYRECHLSSGGRFRVITRLTIPMKLIEGLSADSIKARSILERLFKRAFGVRAGTFKDAHTQNLLWSMPIENRAIQAAQVELPQEVDDGVGRLHRFVDSLYDNQVRR